MYKIYFVLAAWSKDRGFGTVYFPPVLLTGAQTGDGNGRVLEIVEDSSIFSNPQASSSTLCQKTCNTRTPSEVKRFGGPGHIKGKK